jgi:hypothetical protein
MTKEGRGVLGTDLGLYISEDINAASPQWVRADNIPPVPVTTVIQQRLPWNEATNYEEIYVGTYGRGIWKTGDYVNSIEPMTSDAADQVSMTVFPNPVQGSSNVRVSVPAAQQAVVRVFNLNGQVVSEQRVMLAKGVNNLPVDAVNLPGGVYIMKMTGETVEGVARFSKL